MSHVYAILGYSAYEATTMSGGYTTLEEALEQVPKGWEIHTEREIYWDENEVAFAKASTGGDSMVFYKLEVPAQMGGQAT